MSSANNARTRILEAALRLAGRRGGADISMAQIARAARVSRQALYLHFADRGALFIAAVRYSDDRRDIPAEIQKIASAPTGVAAARAFVSLQARMNPDIWPAARALDAARRTDKDVERSWQERLEGRLQACREIVSRLAKEGTLRPGLDVSTAADILWSVTSLRAWEDLVLGRGWTAARYCKRVTELLETFLAPGVHSARSA